MYEDEKVVLEELLVNNDIKITCITKYQDEYRCDVVLNDETESVSYFDIPIKVTDNFIRKYKLKKLNTCTKI